MAERGVPSEAGAALLASPVRRAIVDALANRAHDPNPARPAPGEPAPAEPAPAEPAPAEEVVGLTAAQLAAELELHVTTVRFHLDQLVAAGLLEADFSRRFGVGRPRKVYRVAPGSLTDGSDHEALQLLTGLLAAEFGQGEVSPTEAGERWAREHVPAHADAVPAQTAGGWLSKVAQMVDVLGDWGYTPEVATSEGGRQVTVNLVNCPFLELAQSHPAVVCGIHRGLIAGAMKQLGESDVHLSLEPFVEPHLCRARLRTSTPFRPKS